MLIVILLANNFIYITTHRIGIICYRGGVTFQCYLDMQQTVSFRLPYHGHEKFANH